MAEEQQAGGAAEPARDDAPAPRADQRGRGGERGRDDRERGRDKGRGGERGQGEQGGDGERPGAEGGESRAGEDEAAEREQERERAAGRFKEHTRDPLAGEESEDGPTDLAAASRARRTSQLLFDTGRDWNSFDRSYIGSAHIGDIHLRMDARQPLTGVRGGPVPDEELRRLRRVHVEPEGYVRLRTALTARRLLVLGAAPGTGRTSTALSLLDEVTAQARDDADAAEPPAARVRRVDPEGGVRQLADSLSGEGAEQAARGTGYLLKLELSRPGAVPPEAMDLDQLAAALAACGSYAVLVVTVGSAANPLLAGRYGMLCPPADTQELLTTRLRERVEDHVAAVVDGVAGDAERRVAELLRQAEELAARDEVTEAVGLADLRPAEAELLASLLAGHLLEELSYEELLAGCRSLAARQAQEWFAGVDRALTAQTAGAGEQPTRPEAAALFHPVASRIALAVLGGATRSAVATAAHLLTWELSVQSDPDATPTRPLFCDDPESELALSRAELTDGHVEMAGTEFATRLIWYRGTALPGAVLSEVWDRHFPVRAPVVRWLRLLADDPRAQVWVRAAVAAGELCVRDFDHGHAELVRPLAEATTARRRVFAATLLDQAAGHASHRAVVRGLVGDWARNGTRELRWTAAMALGYGNAAASVGDTLDALARIGVRGEGEQMAVASFNVVRLLTRPDSAAVLRRMSDWTRHRNPAYQDLGLVTTVRLAGHEVADVLADDPNSDLGERGHWPLMLALAATRPELVAPMADLMWTALNTPRSKEVATDAFETLLRSAVRKDSKGSAEGTKPGLAALLPALLSTEADRRRLDWLLRRMMNDPDDPLPDALARQLWRLATPRDGADQARRPERHEVEESHG
ncbi:hypothetical protein [Streptomyces buecherae]|uniref:Uncharacterized protein n=1 Tax=Streptomyces buecherae TaxID=2763006 RepID=A0A7H8NAA9_9ACTN|nr:hypothetical protein [Streptomyces buecherae]QKW51371.1 hypothetical protein HUT08_19585 [Streptomyces buecherae]